MYTNANDFRNKKNELEKICFENDFKVMCITETMLSKDIYDAEFLIKNYRLFRADRLDREGGGSCVYVHNAINSCLMPDFNVTDCLAIKLNTENPIILICVYRSTSLDYKANLALIKSLSDYIAKSKTNHDIVMCGDFNLPQVSWSNQIVRAPVDTRDKTLIIQKLFLDMFVSNNMTWLLKDNNVTRSRVVNGVLQESLLDQVLSTDKNLFKCFEITSPLGKSDHNCISFTINLKTDFSYVTTTKVNWSRLSEKDIAEVNTNIDWTISDWTLGIEELWSFLLEKFQVFEEKAPKYTLKFDKSGNVISKSPWESSSLKKLRNLKVKLWEEFENSPSSRSYNIATGAQLDYEDKVMKCQKNYESKITSGMKTNPKRFYQYLNSKRKIKNTLTSVKNSGGSLTVTAKETANVLGAFFASTFIEDNEDGDNQEQQTTHNSILDLEIDKSDVKDLLSTLNPNKSMGPDMVHPKILKFLSQDDVFVESVTYFLQRCYDQGKMPAVWKTANVTALHKKGDKSDARNYRPISLTCIISKVFEKLLRNHILSHFSPMIKPEQHGFLPKKSCLSNLLDCMNTVYDIMEDGSNVDILYLDFMKAFDSVSHNKLLSKLQSYGIGGKTLSIVKDFLSCRSFKVRVADAESNPFGVKSGVPQGSVLGPLLFLIYINDLPDGIKSCLSLFADDVKMIVATANKDASQEDLELLNSWQKQWKLKFNTVDNKCKVIHIGKGNPGISYYLDGVILPSITTEKDLGVHVDENLTWEQNIQKAVNKAKQNIGWVSRNVLSRSIPVMMNVYKSIIRPHLEYCVQVWSPAAKHGNWGIIMDIEDVQRSYTRMIDGIGLLSYKERLEILKLTTLLERRMRGDLIETFKVLNKLVNYGQNWFNIIRSGRKLKYTQRKEGPDFLANRVVKYWNKLPAYVTSAETVVSFKNQLENFKTENYHLIGNYWELSAEIFSRIQDSSREAYTSFMCSNPQIARRRRINVNVQNL